MEQEERKESRKLNRKQREVEARKAADPVAQLMERDDIDYASDELPSAPREAAAKV